MIRRRSSLHFGYREAGWSWLQLYFDSRSRARVLPPVQTTTDVRQGVVSLVPVKAEGGCDGESHWGGEEVTDCEPDGVEVK